MKAIFLGGLVSVALTVAHLEAFDFAESGLAEIVALMVVPGVGLACVLWGLVAKRRGPWRAGAALVAASVVALVASGLLVRAQERASMKRGDALWSRIEDYRKERGQYPAVLEELVPTFLPGLPRTSMGVLRSRPFFWRVEAGRDGPDYRLGFESPGWMLVERGPDGRWRKHD